MENDLYTGGPGSEPGHGAGPAAGQSRDGSGGRGRGQHRAQVRDVSRSQGARSHSPQHPGLGWGEPGETREGKK